MNSRRSLWWSLASLWLLSASPVLADDDRVAPVTDALTQKECGSCHMAFQPAFLPARSWNQIMDGLDRHFGENAALPAADAAHIRAWLADNAGDVRPYGRARKAMRGLAPQDTPLRISETPDFLHKHRLPDYRWKDPKVVTKSNCLACHPAAARGIYEDDDD